MLQDIRFAVRMLIKSPAFTAVALFVLALGIGANTAIFSAVNAILLRSLPYEDPERLVIPVSINPARKSTRGSVTYADYLDWRQLDQVFEHVATFQASNADLTGNGEPEQVEVAGVSEDYFAVMGVEPLAGRTFTPEEFQPGAQRVMVLSYGLWQTRFGGDPGIIGRDIFLNGRPYPVVGVMPKDSQWPATVQVFAPLRIGQNPPADILRRDNMIWRAAARLKPGVSITEAEAPMRAIAQRLEQEFPESRVGWTAGLIRIDEYIVGPQIRQTLLVLLAAVGFVLLIACVNIANLLLARAARREREIAIRIALGAGRLRLIRQLLTESLLLSVTGGLLGLFVAFWLTQLFVTFGPENIPRLKEVTVDRGVLLFVAAVSVLTSLIFGSIPALHASRTDLNEALKEGGLRSTAGLRSGRLRSLLVVSEVALSLVLLVGAGLMIKSFARLQQVAPGFDVNNLVTINLNMPSLRYPDQEKVATGYETIINRLKSVPGVQSASASSTLPLGGGGFYLGRVFLLEGEPEPPAGPDYPAQWDVVTNDYFNTLGIKLVKGRLFDERDTAKGAPVIIINETMARQMFGDDDPLGKRIRSWRDENILREIVGVVSDVRYFGRDDDLRGLVYIPHRQDTWRSMILTVRTAGDPQNWAGAIRDEIWSADKDLALANVQTMEKVLNDSVAGPRFSMMLLAIFAAMAMVLAAVGIYGILSYSVAQRSHEIGVRMALGAARGDVLRLVVGQGVRMILVGVGVGLVGAFAATRVMKSLLYEVSATDPITFVAVSLLLGAVALVACYVPARRASKIDPMVALRYE